MRDPFSSHVLPNLHPRSVNVGGILTYVWGLEHLPSAPDTEIAVMFLLHGRRTPLEDYDGIVKYILAETWKCSELDPSAKSLLVVTYDGRNHGPRLVDPIANEPWDKNPNHAFDLYSMYSGTASEVSYLIDFLPCHLFPEQVPKIKTWICAGASLGGHATWIAGGRDPRIRHMIPIIASPDYHTLLTDRASRLSPSPIAPSVPLSSPHYPPALSELVRSHDPVHMPLSVWQDKQILVLSGGKDPLVPYTSGGSEVFVKTLNTEGVDVVVFLDVDGVHEVTKTMVEHVVHWLWQRALLGSA